MTKIQILTTCAHCDGKAYLPAGEAVSANGEAYIRHIPCPVCDGSGQAPKWITLQELITLLVQTQCPHNHTSLRGGLHLSAGDMWDDIREVCDDCGATVQGQTLGDFIIDPA